MGHNLYINSNDEAAFASTEPAWHGLGQIVASAMTSEECIKLAHLNFEVKKIPLVAKVPVGNFSMDVPVPDKYATMRTDTNVPLGVVGSKYTVLQNKDAFKFFDPIVGEGEAIYETAGALGNGEKIFITAKLPQSLVITPDDTMDNYLFLTNSHDGTGMVTAFFTPVRVVCNNTFNMALRNNKYKIKMRHTPGLIQTLEEAHQFMNIANRQGQQLVEECQMMTKVFITDDQLKKFVEMALRPTREQITDEEFSTRFVNQVESILEYAGADPTQQMNTTRGTLYGAFNAITGYYNNVRTYDTPGEKTKQIMFGNGKTVSNRAYELCLDGLSNTNFLN